MTTYLELRAQFELGKRSGSSYLLMVCDQFEWEDYSVFVDECEDIFDCISYYRHSPMQQIMGIYDLNQNRDEQLNAPRNFRHPPFPKDYKYTPHTTAPKESDL